MNPNQTIFLAHDRIVDLRRDVDRHVAETRTTTTRRPTDRKIRFAAAVIAISRRLSRSGQSAAR